MFLSDYAAAVAIARENGSSPDASISLVWVCTSLPSLTKVATVLTVVEITITNQSTSFEKINYRVLFDQMLRIGLTNE